MVVVIDNNIKQSFDARTDMEWADVLDEARSHFGKPSSEIQMVYRIGETGVMSYLADKNDWDKAMCQLQERIKAAWTRAVSMEIKNIVSGMHKLTTRKYSQFTAQVYARKWNERTWHRKGEGKTPPSR